MWLDQNGSKDRLENKWVTETLLAEGFIVSFLLFFLLAFHSNLTCNLKSVKKNIKKYQPKNAHSMACVLSTEPLSASSISCAERPWRSWGDTPQLWGSPTRPRAGGASRCCGWTVQLPTQAARSLPMSTVSWFGPTEAVPKDPRWKLDSSETLTQCTNTAQSSQHELKLHPTGD